MKQEYVVKAIQELRSDDGENTEYDRALLELFNQLMGTELKTLDDVKEN